MERVFRKLKTIIIFFIHISLVQLKLQNSLKSIIVSQHLLVYDLVEKIYLSM